MAATTHFKSSRFFVPLCTSTIKLREALNMFRRRAYAATSPTHAESGKSNQVAQALDMPISCSVVEAKTTKRI